MHGTREYVSSGHTINLSEFLETLEALEILHIGARNCILHGNTGMICDVLASTVQIFTVRDEDFQRMDVKYQGMIVDAIDAGRLVDNSGVEDDYWSGVEVDRFVAGWVNLDHNYDDRPILRLC